MKKLLLAGLILAMSATAMATGETATDSLTVSANYIVPITVVLDTTSIDFKDVYNGSAAEVKSVIATLTGETGETYSYAATTETTGIVLSGATGTGTIGTNDTFTFGIDMDRTEGGFTDFTDQLVTVTVNYTAIDDTVIVVPTTPVG